MKKLLAGAIAGTVLLGAGVVVMSQPEKVELREPQKLVWEKPTTDEEWNADIKEENSIHIRSTEVLEIMSEAQREKLERQKKAFERYEKAKARGVNPVDILYLEWYDKLKLAYPDEPEEWWESEAQKQAQEQYDRELWEIEKITQSIERIDKEIELRAKGFVVVPSEGDDTKPLFGAAIPPERIRETIVD